MTNEDVIKHIQTEILNLYKNNSCRTPTQLYEETVELRRLLEILWPFPPITTTVSIDSLSGEIRTQFNIEVPICSKVHPADLTEDNFC